MLLLMGRQPGLMVPDDVDLNDYEVGSEFLWANDKLAQWVAHLTCGRWIPVSREFEPHQRPPLFP